MPQIITEAGTVTTGGATGKLLITLITPGWGSSVYYSPALLEQAAKDKVFPAGTQQHIDHMSRKDAHENPAGSLTTLAAVLTEDARWENGRLVAEAKLGSRYRDTITEFAEYIGTSIAVGADVTIGEAEGRKGQIIEKLYPDPLNRVDFVTVAGRGGKVDKVLEAIAGRAVEATANDTRNALSAAVTEAYGADGVWLWVLDYDDKNVWFTQESADESKTWQQAYTMGDTAALTGDLIEVRRVTSYVPIDAAAAESVTVSARDAKHIAELLIASGVDPAEVDAAIESVLRITKDSPSAPAGVTEKKEPTMATIQIEESVHADLVEKSSRTTALEAELTEARTKLAAAESATATAQAESIVAEAFGDIEAKATRRSLVKAALAAESFDADALKADAVEAAAEIRAERGEGQPRGVGFTGSVTESADVADADVLTALKGA